MLTACSYGMKNLFAQSADRHYQYSVETPVGIFAHSDKYHCKCRSRHLVGVDFRT